MKLSATLFLLFLAGPAGAAGLSAASEPQPAVKDAGLVEALAQRAGSPVVINFWAPWCAPCRDEMPSLQRLAERWRGRGVSVLTVAVADRDEQAGDFLWQIGVTLPVLRDPDQILARAWGVRTLPATLVLDSRHRIVARWRGAVDWDASPTDRRLQTLLK